MTVHDKILARLAIEDARMASIELIGVTWMSADANRRGARNLELAIRVWEHFLRDDVEDADWTAPLSYLAGDESDAFLRIGTNTATRLAALASTVTA